MKISILLEKNKVLGQLLVCTSSFTTAPRWEEPKRELVEIGNG